MAPRSRAPVCGLEAETGPISGASGKHGRFKVTGVWGVAAALPPCAGRRSSEAPGHVPLGAPSPPSSVCAGRGAQGSSSGPARAALRVEVSGKPRRVILATAVTTRSSASSVCITVPWHASSPACPVRTSSLQMVTWVCCHGRGVLCLAWSLPTASGASAAVGRAVPTQSPGTGFCSMKGMN